MLKRIKARNFLSLKDIELELRPRNVLVGPNMSGKSNLIECLRFIQDAVALRSQSNTSALQEAFSKRGGFPEVAWKGQPEGPISLGFSAEMPGTAGERLRCYKYEFSIRRSAYGSPEVNSEKLTVESGALRRR